MSTADQQLLSAFDGHEVESVRTALEAGADPCCTIRGKLPVDWLLEEYTRSDRLADCLRLLFERGAVLRDPAVAPVLLNDADAIRAAVKATPSPLEHRTTLTSAFTFVLREAGDGPVLEVAVRPRANSRPRCSGCGQAGPRLEVIGANRHTSNRGNINRVFIVWFVVRP